MKFCCFNPTNSEEDKNPIPSPEDFGAIPDAFVNFTEEQITAITKDFSIELGGGAFGLVYRGDWEGRPVAVKRLTDRVSQGEFMRELEVSTLLQHNNVVKLLGYSYQEHGMLVFEFVPGGNLQDLIKGGTLSWQNRVRIATGIASGLQYMNGEAGFLHMDIKPANIVIDDDFTPKIIDFGLTRKTPKPHERDRNIFGSLGYRAVEYGRGGQVLMSYDAYSFGVLLLVLLTGRSPIWSSITQTDGVPIWFLDRWPQADTHVLADPQLQGNYDEHQMRDIFGVAYLCIRDLYTGIASERPTMDQVLGQLLAMVAPALDDGAIDLDDD